MKQSFPGAEKSQRIMFVGAQHPSARENFMDAPERHAEIEVVERAIAQDAIFPALLVGDFLNIAGGSRVKRDQPLIVPDEALRVAFGFKPAVAQHQADGLSVRGADPAKNQARFEVAKVIERDPLRFRRRRSELPLITELEGFAA